jgi:predicted RNA-binding Zn ribbon-like protein
MSFLCIEFANSWWSLVCRQFSDTQKTKEWLKQLAGKWDIGPLPEISDDEMKRLLEIRKSFEALLKRATEGPLSASDIKLVNGYMSKVSFFRQLREGKEYCGLCDVPIVRDWNWFTAEAAASFSRLYASDKINKLKVCQNPVCGRFFIDESKSGNRKWCDNTCASLIKVRRFRQRQKEIQN